MLKISQFNNINFPITEQKKCKELSTNTIQSKEEKQNFVQYSAENLKAYIPSFSAKQKETNSTNNIPSRNQQIRTIKSKLDKNSQLLLNRLEQNGILDDNNSNDGSTVLDNLYKIATEPRIRGLSDTLIITECRVLYI